MNRNKGRILAAFLVLVLSVMTLASCNIGNDEVRIIAIKDIVFDEAQVTVIYEDGYELVLQKDELLTNPLSYSGMSLSMGGIVASPDGFATVEKYTVVADSTSVGKESIAPEMESAEETKYEKNAREGETVGLELRTYVVGLGTGENAWISGTMLMGVRVMGTQSYKGSFSLNGDAFASVENMGQDIVMSVTGVSDAYMEINGKKYAVYDTDPRFAEYFSTRLTQVTVNRVPEMEGMTAKINRILSGGFSNMKVLESVSLPDTIDTIESKAFYNCEALKDIFFAGTMEQWKAIRKSANWNEGTGDYTVHCADGDILKSEDILPSVDEEKK